MSKVSIYENGWTNLVFEGKNKEYGAFQLRKNDSVTTVTAFFFGLLFIISIYGIAFLLSSFSTKEVVKEKPIVYPDIHLVKFDRKKIDEPKKAVAPIERKKPEIINSKKDLINPTIVRYEPIDDINKTKDVGKTAPIDTGSATGTINTIPINTGGSPDTNTTKSDEPLTTNRLDKLPEFPGGINKFYSYVGNNFEKPEIEGEETISVYVAFVIEEDGTMSNIKVTRDPGYGLGKEAVRVLKSLKTKWTPGMIGGQPVRTSYYLPISVKLE
jgi:protein TonB